MIKEFFKIPETCPSCDNALYMEGEFLVCPFFYCSSRRLGNLKKWIKVLDIEECGDSFLNDIQIEFNIKDPADLYTLKTDQLMTLPGYQDTKASKIIGNIQQCKNLTFEEFCAGLNIPNISTSTFVLLKKAGINSINALKSTNYNALMSITGIGEITAQTIVDAFHDERLIQLINKLAEVDVIIKEEVKGKLTGMSFCFTGELTIKRPDAMRFVKELGGEVKSSVSKGLTYLVQANPQSASSKSEKARKYGTKVIGEQEFFDLIDFTFEKLLR